MAPHAEETNGTNGAHVTADVPSSAPAVNAGEAPLEPGVKKNVAQDQVINFPRPPTFEDKYKERDYLKGRLAAAFRIFGKYVDNPFNRQRERGRLNADAFCVFAQVWLR